MISKPQSGETLAAFPLKAAGAEEIAQWLRALAVLPKDAGSIPSLYMAAHNYL